MFVSMFEKGIFSTSLSIVLFWIVFSITGCFDLLGKSGHKVLVQCSAKNRVGAIEESIFLGSDFVIQHPSSSYDEEFSVRMRRDVSSSRGASESKKHQENPDIQYCVFHIRSLIDCRKLQEARKEYEALVRLLAKRSESYIAVDSLAVDLLIAQGEKKEAISLVLELTKRIGPSKKWISYLHLIDLNLKSSELKKVLADLESKHRRHRTEILSHLRGIKPQKSILKSDQVIQMVCHTRCFPKFKLMLKSDRFAADSGVVRYLVSPPSFDQVTLVNDESRNFLSMSIRNLLIDHCGYADKFYDYGSVSKLGSESVAGLNADVYKISMIGESSYHILKVARDVQLASPLYRSISEICLIQEIGAVPLELKSYHMGWMDEILRVERASFSPAVKADSYFQLPKHYHHVRTMGELIYAEEGELKNSDLDAFMQGSNGR